MKKGPNSGTSRKKYLIKNSKKNQEEKKAKNETPHTYCFYTWEKSRIPSLPYAYADAL